MTLLAALLHEKLLSLKLSIDEPTTPIPPISDGSPSPIPELSKSLLDLSLIAFCYLNPFRFYSSFLFSIIGDDCYFLYFNSLLFSIFYISFYFAPKFLSFKSIFNMLFYEVFSSFTFEKFDSYNLNDWPSLLYCDAI